MAVSVSRACVCARDSVQSASACILSVSARARERARASARARAPPTAGRGVGGGRRRAAKAAHGGEDPDESNRGEEVERAQCVDMHVRFGEERLGRRCEGGRAGGR
eukprot:6183679-Pleurochrysis_carterae.AAC.1